MSGFDTLFIHGNILAPERLPLRSAVAVKEGKVVCIADEASLLDDADAHVTIVDLEGGSLVPGFEDAHAHIWKVGQLLTTSLDLRGVSSIEKISSLIRERNTKLPADAWLLGRGFNEISMAEGRIPTRRDLDLCAPDRPVLLTRTCGHIFVANSRALELAGIDRHAISPDGGVIEREASGEPSGILHETAVGLVNRVIPAPTRSEYRAMLTAALKHQLSVGITSSSDCGVLPALLDTYLEMDADGTLPARMNVMPLGRPDGVTGPLHLAPQQHSIMLRIDTVKFLADGGLSGATSALSVPYRNSDKCGVTRFADGEFEELFLDAQKQGWRIATHAIGDAAIEQVLAAYESLPAHPRGWAHRMEHVGLPSRAQLARMKKANVMAVTQPIFLDELGANFGTYLPDALADRVYPVRQMFEAGLVVSFSSDAPVVVNDSPLAGIKAAILRRTTAGEVILPAESVTAEQSLWAYTVGSAMASGEESTRGRIKPGYWADFALLSDDPTSVDPEALDSIRVTRTYLGGKLVYAA